MIKLYSRYSFSCVLLFLFVELNSQEEINLYGGYNHSTITFTNFSESGWDFKKGYFIGVENLKNIGNKIDLSTNLQYSSKGWRTSSTKLKESFKYIDLINTISYRPIDQISIFAGINTGILLNSNSTRADRIFDLGLVLGGGFHYNRWNIKLHYNHGLTSIESNNPNIDDLKVKILNTNFQLGIGYNLYKGGKALLKTKNTFNEHIIGIKIYGLNSNFGLLYKRKFAENRFIRINSFVTQLDYYIQDDRDDNVSTSFGLNIGIEKVVPLNDKLSFLHGIQPGISLSSKSNTISVSARLGYLLGLCYSINDNFMFGIESSPYISTRLDYRSSLADRDVPILMNLSLSSIGIFGLYRFNYSL